MKKKYINKVCSKLEKGNGSIKGMKMLYPLENRCLIEVTVVGIDFTCSGYNSVSLTIEPCFGVGSLVVDATSLIDDKKAARELYFRKNEARNFAESNRLSTNSDKNWRALVSRHRAKLDDSQIKKFDKLVVKRLVDKTIAKASEWELKEVWNDLITVKFKLYEDDQIVDRF